MHHQSNGHFSRLLPSQAVASQCLLSPPRETLPDSEPVPGRAQQSQVSFEHSNYYAALAKLDTQVPESRIPEARPRPAPPPSSRKVKTPRAIPPWPRSWIPHGGRPLKIAAQRPGSTRDNGPGMNTDHYPRRLPSTRYLHDFFPWAKPTVPSAQAPGLLLPAEMHTSQKTTTSSGKSVSSAVRSAANPGSPPADRSSTRPASPSAVFSTAHPASPAAVRSAARPGTPPADRPIARPESPRADSSTARAAPPPADRFAARPKIGRAHV